MCVDNSRAHIFFSWDSHEMCSQLFYELSIADLRETVGCNFARVNEGMQVGHFSSQKKNQLAQTKVFDLIFKRKIICTCLHCGFISKCFMYIILKWFFCFNFNLIFCMPIVLNKFFCAIKTHNYQFFIKKLKNQLIVSDNRGSSVTKFY